MEVKKFIFILLLMIFPVLVSGASTSFGNPALTQSFSSYNSQAQFTNPSFQNIYSGAQISTFWPQYSESSEMQCQDNNDFLIMIPPGGCSPAVVRSDLLGDQNVPVFCQLIGAKVNPLIKVSSIKSISFKGKYPNEVAGISFHPARAAVRSYNSILGSPIVNNLGYVVIVLKKQANESAMNKFVSGNLTATLAYDAQNAFGTGSAEYYLETVDESDWQQGRGQASFWQGRGLLRVIDVVDNKARIAVYTTEDKKLTEFTLKIGETSPLFYFPGFYCNAGIKVKLNSLVGEEDKALLNIDGDEIWVVKGSKVLDGRCTITSVDLIAGTTGTVGVRCPGSSFKLSLLNSLSANILPTGDSSLDTFNLFNVSNTVYTGKKEDKSSSEYDWHLAYTGVSQIDVGRLKVNSEFIVLLAQEKNKLLSQDLYSKLNEAIRTTTGVRDLTDFESALARKLGLGSDKIKVIISGDSVNASHSFKGLINYGKEIATSSDSTKNSLTADQIKLAKEYFDYADKSLQELLATNPAARDSFSTYGEQGLISVMGLIDELNAKGIHDYDSKKIELANKFLELYPDSSQSSYVRDQLSRTTNYDSSNAFNSVYVNNAYHTISLREFYSVPLENRKTSFVLTPASGKTITGNGQKEGDRLNLTDQTNSPYVVVNDIQPLRVSLDFYNWTRNGYQKTTRTFSYSSERDLAAQKITVGDMEYNVLITDVEVKEVAYVSLVSELKTHSESNFSFKIGIEQRNIKINPEKAKEVSNSLNETIKKWEDRNAALGKLVEKWKGVCLATGLGLQVKNLFGGFTGESLARQEVMKVYKNYCLSNDSINGAEARTMTKSQCYGALSESISKDIECYKNAMKAVENNTGSQTLDQWKSANQNNAVQVLQGKTISTNDFNTFEDVKTYLLNQEVQKCSGASEQLKKSILGSTNNQLYTLYTMKNQNAEIATNAAELPIIIQDSARVVTKTKEGYDIKNIQEITVSELKQVIESSSSIDYSSPTGKVFALLDSVGDSKLGIATVKEVGGKWKLILAKQVSSGGVFSEAGIFDFSVNSDKTKINILEDSSGKELRTSRITFSSTIGKNCNYQYKDPKVRFYDSGSNKGMPAIVPFDKQGWYVLVPQSSGGFLSDNVKGYTASGIPTYYYICSVGSNGIMELRSGDDSCFSNNYNTDSGTYGDCALSSAKVQSMRSQAESAIRQAAQQYGKVKAGSKININGLMVGIDAPMTDDGNLPYECEDFMSVDDCKILYNVCDPVICPSSRCDFGGQTKVSNVIQSGIIGSLLLCSKNFIGFGGDVFVPFCLTGVHAGIEGYVSILKASRDCMAQAAATGQHVGICDEITAVYKCEFFWRQAAPLMQNLIPNVAEFLYTGGQKGFGRNQGGGEYATFQASWDNMQKSLDYFKNNYASTSFSAVKFGNIEEVGTEFCRSFVGTSLPASGNALNQLLKPESPYQFYAQFSEIPFTEATVPATSQYKVFYHIYAGTDQGVSYQVYLKNPPSSSYYYNAERVSIKVGYIAAGGQVSETKDVTLPAGYKELCVIVNGREECGFKSVTTDYGLDMLNSVYTKDQANKKDIKTEKECIQESSSVYALANLNPQAGVEAATQPNIALNGIVRVCATENPGKGTNSNRWAQVGTCGSDNIKCWLDQNSVKKTVSQIYGATGTISSAEEAIKSKVNTNSGTMTEEETSALLLTVRTNISNLAGIDKSTTASNINNKIQPTLNSIDKLISFAYLDLQQAEALLQKYYLYDKVVRLILGVSIYNGNRGGSTTSVVTATPATVAAQAAADIASSSTSTTSPRVSIGSNNVIMVNGADSGYVLASAGGDYYLVKKGDAIVARVTKNQPISISSSYSDLSSLNGCTYGGVDLSCSSVA